jgi:hypothetical protein
MLVISLTRAYIYQLADRNFATRETVIAASEQFEDQYCDNLGSHNNADGNSDLLRYNVQIFMQL